MNALKIGDDATGTKVLENLYDEMKTKPVQVDLEGLWRELGVSADGRKIRFDDDADLAPVRLSITEDPAHERETVSQLGPALH